MRFIQSIKTQVLIVLWVIGIGGCNAANIYYDDNNNGTYTVRGVVNAHELEYRNSASWASFRVVVHTTGTNYVSYESPYTCPLDATGAAAFINSRLTDGILVAKKEIFIDDGNPWTSSITCHTDYPGPGYWYVTSLSSPPTQPVCQVSVPDTVDFGTVGPGAAQKSLQYTFSIACNRGATGTATFTNLTNGHVKVGDATVSPRFGGGGASVGFTTLLNEFSSPLTFLLDNAGTSLGVKVGMAVLIVSWD